MLGNSVHAVELVFLLLLLFVVAMVCHGELARLRPPVERLTGFYLWIASGGVLAGAFNRGFGDYALTYRSCTGNAQEVIAHYLEESGRIARDIAGRYGG